MTTKSLFVVLCLALFLVGCGNGAQTVADPPPMPADFATESPPEEPVATTEAVTPDDTPTSEPESSLPPLPLEAQRIEFQAEDGAALVGYYYPAAVNPAPAVILMHWGGGNQTDWLYLGMVSWLQNRGAPIPASPGQLPFDTPYPFPGLHGNQSFAVFTFDFRGFGESGGRQFENFNLDARAAYNIVAGLEGVDPARIAGIGGSIGANGAAGGCNENCIGALSLGPQDFGGFVYADAVQAMDALEKPAWCVAAEDVGIDLATCNSASGKYFQKTIYPSGGHAMTLFRVEIGLNPPIETVIADFLKLVFALP